MTTTSWTSADYADPRNVVVQAGTSPFRDIHETTIAKALETGFLREEKLFLDIRLWEEELTTQPLNVPGRTKLELQQDWEIIKPEINDRFRKAVFTGSSRSHLLIDSSTEFYSKYDRTSQLAQRLIYIIHTSAYFYLPWWQLAFEWVQAICLKDLPFLATQTTFMSGSIQ